MEEDIYPTLATDMAMAAISNGVARKTLSREQIMSTAEQSIKEARTLVNHLMEAGYIKRPPADIIDRALKTAIAKVG